MSNFKLKEVIDKTGRKSFLEVPVKIYEGYKNWVRPLDNDIEKIFDPQENKFFNEGEAIRWVLEDENGKAIGRIAAFYNSDIASQSEQMTGGCGFFECINDQQAANILFDASVEWLKSKGMEAMDGPINFGERDQWWGLLVEGFSRPVYAMNFNHPYYQELFENYGFKNFFNQYSYKRSLSGSSLNPVVIEKARRLRENPDYLFKHIKKRELPSLVEDFRFIYNKAWSLFTGVKEMTSEQTQKLMNSIKPIIDEKLIYFAYYKGDPIGFFIMVPDLNGAIRHLNGKLNLWARLKFFYHLKIRKSCNIIQGLIFAVIPEFQGKGVESGLIDLYKDVISTSTNYSHMELVWIGDFNPLMIRMVEKYVCAEKCKTHITYRYLFDREKEFKRAPRVSIARATPEN